MVEYEAANILLTGPGDRLGRPDPHIFWVGADPSPSYSDDDLVRDRDPDGSVLFLSYSGIRAGQGVFKVHPVSIPSNTYQAEKFRRRVGRARVGVTSINNGMFSARDRLARVGVVHTPSGLRIPRAEVLLFGAENNIALRTDGRGIWWGYLPVDVYSDAVYIGRSGAVFELAEETEDPPESGILYHMVRRRGRGTLGGYRMIHRRGV